METKAALAAISTGFDRVAARPLLILPPLILDLILWLGPRMRTSRVLGALSRSFQEAQGLLSDEAGAMPDLLESLLEGFNLLSALSPMRAGIPSLMAGRMPAASPIGESASVEVSDPLSVVLVWLLLSMLGIVLGTIYQRWIARAVSPEAQLGSSGAAIVRMILFGLALLIGGLIVGAIVGLAVAVSTLILPILGLGVFSLGFILVFWLAVYLVFTPQGIVRNDLGVVSSMLESFTIVRWNFLSTVVFLMLVVGSSWILNIVWGLPEDESWFSLLAILGHAFVSATLLAGTYVFYQGRRDRMIAAATPIFTDEEPALGQEESRD